MQMVCEATQGHDSKLSISALQCLAKIMSLYYKHMQPYMERALFAVGQIHDCFRSTSFKHSSSLVRYQ